MKAKEIGFVAIPVTDMDRARIPIVSEGVQVAADGLAKHRDHGCLAQLCDLADRGDAAVVQLSGGDAANSPQVFDPKRVKKAELVVGRHDQQAVRLGYSAGHFGQEFGARDADGDRQADLFADCFT